MELHESNELKRLYGLKGLRLWTLKRPKGRAPGLHLRFELCTASPYAGCMTKLQQAIQDSVTTTQALAAIDESLNLAAQMVLTSLTAGRKLLICGNGGSASDATHMATEFLCRFMGDRRPYAALSLTANGEFLTAMGNDYHFDEVFARQVWGLGEKGDVLISFTTSGKSKNVLRAVEEANKKGVLSISFLGRDGGFTIGKSTLDILVPGTNTARIQEAHRFLFHVLCEIVEEKIPK